VFVPGYAFFAAFAAGFFCSTGGVKGFGCPGFTTLFLSDEGNALLPTPYGLGSEFDRVFAAGLGLERGPLIDGVAPVRAFCPPPTTPPVTPPNGFASPPVVLLAVPTLPVTAFFAPLNGAPPGYLFAPSGFAPTDLEVPVVGLFDAGNEFDRLTTGLRAVEGRALGEGW
jgi:hypothetical protein